MFLALTGYRLNGADVYHAGLATHYVGYLCYLNFCYNNLKGSTKNTQQILNYMNNLITNALILHQNQEIQFQPLIHCQISL